MKILFALLPLSLFSFSASAQKVLFNDNWKFTSVEFVNQYKKTDSSRKLGNNWSDQFLIEKINAADSSSPKHPVLNDELLLIKNKKWETAILPHIAFPEPLVIVKPREGIAYYKKEFVIEKKLSGKKLAIEFEGAMQVADVWVNGVYVQKHLGGYLPFTVDITELAHYGDNNTIVLKLQNKANPIIPPGKPVSKLDFIYYSGIYRNVWLHIDNALHITDANAVNKQAGGGIFVTYPSVSKQQATVNIQTHVWNESKTDKHFSIIQNLVDPSGKIVATTKSDEVLSSTKERHYTQQLQVNEPLLWHPDHPYLYKLETVIKENNTVYDKKNTRIGIRSFQIIKEKGLLINGEPFVITGTNRHQNYPYIGNTLSDNANYRDAYIIKSAGMNCIRTAHYPQSPSFLDAADELGILIVDCIPGWQFFNKDAAFANNVFSDIRQTIRRDRNHPAILLWEVSLNETYPPASFRCKQNEVAKSEWIGEKNFYTSGDSYYTKACWDVPYDDWAHKGKTIIRDNFTYPDNSFLTREYGDYEFGGGNSTSRQLRGDGQNALLQQAWNFQWEHNKNKQSLPRGIGDLTWAFYDGLAGVTNVIEGWGSCDIFRIPKFTYYFFQSQRPVEFNKYNKTESGPMVFIANYWAGKSEDKKVIVYSNCNEVALYLNNKLVAKQKPDNGPETDYGTELDKGGKPFDGGNCNRLDHPPFTFRDVAFAPGTLKAVALMNGKEVVSYQVATPGRASAIQLQIKDNGKKLSASGSDVVFVYAKIVDSKGNLCVNEKRPVHLQLSGNAKIVCPATINAEAGIATFLVQTGAHASAIHLTASADGLHASTFPVKIY